jgi:CRISPR system Cascade subunit CasA
MPTYDLTREGWIPVLMLEGERREMSLRDVLAKAHCFREVSAGSPLEAAALYRLLQALVLRIFAEEMSDIDSWFDLLEAGHFSPERVHGYFDEWQDEKERFDLLHPEYPFYQHLEPLTNNMSAPGQLFAGESSGNNATLFSHELDDTPRRLPLADAARGIVATQAAALGGGYSKPFYFSSAPLADGAVFWIRGHNLFEALLLNCPPSEKGRMGYFPDDESCPIWERGEPYAAAEKRAEIGYLDYLTWPSRRPLLQTDETENGKTVACGVRISQGDKKEGGGDDPLMAYVQSKSTGIFPFKMDKDRSVWRDAHVFFRQFRNDEGGAPPALSWVAGESPIESTLKGREWVVDVFGFVSDQAKIELWRHERLPFYPVILRDGERYELLQQAVEHAERQGGILKSATRTAAAKLLFPSKEEGELSQKEREKVRDLAQSFGVQTRFWARLEVPFFEWLDDLAGGGYDARRLSAHWLQTLHREAKEAYRSATASFDASGRHLRARTVGEDRLYPAAPYRDDLIPKEVPA